MNQWKRPQYQWIAVALLFTAAAPATSSASTGILGGLCSLIYTPAVVGLEKARDAWVGRKIELDSLTTPVVRQSIDAPEGAPRKLTLTFPIKPEYTLDGDRWTPKSGRRFNGNFSAEDNARIDERTMDMARLGYILKSSAYARGTGTLNFVKAPELVTTQERTPEPDYVAVQRTMMQEAFPSRGRSYPASAHEVYAQDIPSGIILSAKTIDRLKPGLYSYARLVGENFLRLGYDHRALGAAENAMAGGDLEIQFNPQTGHNEVIWVNTRSDTYQPPLMCLPNAVDALWEQNLFSRNLRLLEWNRKSGVDISVPEVAPEPRRAG